MGFLLAAILGGFFLFNSQATPSKVEHKAQAALQKRFPGAQVQVHVEGKRGADVLHGKFKTVQINLSNLGRINGLPLLPADNAKHQGHVGHFELQMRDFIWNGLPLELASFSFDDLAYDFDALKKESLLKLVKSGPSSARLVVPAVSLETVVRTRIKDLQNPHVTVRGNTITIEGKKPLPLLEVPVPFTLTANLEARNGGEVWLTHPQVTMVDVPVGPTIGSSLVGHVNPIYVFDREHKWPFRVHITSIHAQNNKLQMDADLPFISRH